MCVTNDHGYVPRVVSTFRSFPHSRLITGFVARVTRRMPIVEHELKQRSTKHAHKTIDQVTRTPLKSVGELM
jgi:hypothetical protein